MATPRKGESFSDYTPDEQALFAKILEGEDLLDHVTGIQGLGLRTQALDLQDDLDWVDGLQEENEQLHDKNGKLEEEIAKMARQLEASGKVNPIAMANLRVELFQAHIIIKNMTTKYRDLKNKVEAGRQARAARVAAKQQGETPPP
ncbi:hypothetical protein TWF506_004151 [Arthrobotrys conoides]|uniref:Uncharacterized protein n=1 Tax=Arthrobotrys conoides TaxID=74498 RepID=A0AAN8RQ28_9PEZI